MAELIDNPQDITVDDLRQQEDWAAKEAKPVFKMRESNVKIKIEPAKPLDFSSLTEDDIYNLDIPMIARPFDTEDQIKAELKDSNYVARWVNKDARRLGAMLGRGFTYVREEDLQTNLNLAVFKDANGNYALGDVILMKCQKEKYYMALRNAHLRAVASVSRKGAHNAAIAQTNAFLAKEGGADYNAAVEGNKVEIYSPELK